MKKNIHFLCIAFLGLMGHAQQLEIPTEVKENIKARIEMNQNTGIVVGLIDGDAVTYFSYGKTSLENGTPVNEHSVFEIGSISKVFTTTLLADQILEGTMKLSDPIANYLPKEVKVPSRNGKEITLKDLATHSSGLPRMPDNFAPANPYNPFADYTVKQLYAFLSGHELKRDIGESYEYSNLGMGLLGHILEQHTNKSFEEQVKDKIANVHGMGDTRLVFTPAMEERLAKGHTQGRATENWDIVSLAGAGGLRSTASDMVKFIQANMATGTLPIHKAMKMSHGAAYENATQNFVMGLGWHYANNGAIIWHNGATGGYSAFSGFIKGTQKGVVVLSNSNESIDDLGIKLLDSTRTLKAPKKKIVPVEISVSEEVLQTYVGKYQLTPTFSIEITRTGQQLFLQATGQQKFQIFASAQNEFFLKVVEASITFNTDDTGKVESLTLHQGGQNPVGKKVE